MFVTFKSENFLSYLFFILNQQGFKRHTTLSTSHSANNVSRHETFQRRHAADPLMTDSDQ